MVRGVRRSFKLAAAWDRVRGAYVGPQPNFCAAGRRIPLGRRFFQHESKILVQTCGTWKLSKQCEEHNELEWRHAGNNNRFRCKPRSGSWLYGGTLPLAAR